MTLPAESDFLLADTHAFLTQTPDDRVGMSALQARLKTMLHGATSIYELAAMIERHGRLLYLRLGKTRQHLHYSAVNVDIFRKFEIKDFHIENEDMIWFQITAWLLPNGLSSRRAVLRDAKWREFGLRLSPGGHKTLLAIEREAFPILNAHAALAGSGRFLLY